MLFDKILNKVAEMKVAGHRLKDAHLFRVDTASLDNEDVAMLNNQMHKLASHFFEMMQTRHQIRSIPYRQAEYGEIGELTYPNAKPPFKNMVIQTRARPNKPMNCFWLLTHDEGYSFIPLSTDYGMINSHVQDLREGLWLLDDVSPYEEDGDSYFPRDTFIRMTYYLNGNTLDFNETYVMALNGENFPYSPVKKCFAMVDLASVLKVLSIINCSNIEYVLNRHPEKVQKKRAKKNKLPLKDYYTLVIKRKRQYHAYDRTKGPGAYDTRLHMCRGHFKTYTQDRPLFGRYTGTYWWQEQMRGNAGMGEIEKEYAVQA